MKYTAAEKLGFETDEHFKLNIKQLTPEERETLKQFLNDQADEVPDRSDNKRNLNKMSALELEQFMQQKTPAQRKQIRERLQNQDPSDNTPDSDYPSESNQDDYQSDYTRTEKMENIANLSGLELEQKMQALSAAERQEIRDHFRTTDG